MVFSSHLFLFYFLPPVLALYYACPRPWRALFLTLVSYLFYGWANPWFVFLMLFSTIIDYAAGKLIVGEWGASPAPERQRRAGVALSVVVNLTLLGVFKYLGFAQANLNWILEHLGRPTMEVFRVTLPVGISFYTFQSMSYSIDLYRGQARPARSFLDFACYVSLFPQLVAGPIVRYHELAEQLVEREHSVRKFGLGVLFFVAGFVKKILFANPCGEVADAAFGAGTLAAPEAWVGVLGYAFQIYFDFSGYSDMAVGLGLMLGFEFPRNFCHPYRADSITDFWRRWHISLSTWLRDYLYIPLGGNRRGVATTYRNLILVMFLGGLWHGAEWTFVVWGMIHGAALIAERLMGKQPLYANAPRALRVIVTFGLILLTWVFFRAEGIGAAWAYLGAMFAGGLQPTLSAGVLYSPDHLLALFAAAGAVWLLPDTWELVEPVTVTKARWALVLMLVAVVVMFTQAYNPFLYFRF